MAIGKRAAAVALSVLAALVAVLAFAAPSGADPYSKGARIGVASANPRGCDKLTVTGKDFQANELVDLTLHTATFPLGTAQANAAGNFSIRVDLPSGVTGAHTIVATGETSGKSALADITIRPCKESSGGSGGQTPSSTGVAVIAISTLGVVLLLAGGVFLYSGRRRRSLA